MKLEPWCTGLLLQFLCHLTVFTGECSSDEGGKVVLCYVVGWAQRRLGPGRFTVADVNTDLCTHVVYAFMGLNETTDSIKYVDRVIDVDNQGNRLHQVSKLKELKRRKKDLKVLASIGGWTEGGRKFSDMAGVPQRRRAFIRNVLRFLRDYSLDGLDVCWQFPGERGGRPEDTSTSLALFRELKEAFEPEGYLLTIHILAHRHVMERYDIREVSKIVDYINLAAVEFNGPWRNKSSIMSPLKSDDYNNVIASVDYMIKKGAKPKKLLLGLGFYGQTFVLDQVPRKDAFLGIGLDPQRTFQSPRTKQSGFLSYYEMCDYLLNFQGWVEHWDVGSMTPVAFSGKKFVSYENKRSLILKVDLVKSKSLGGVMIWAIDLDDFHGFCDGTKFPMLTAVVHHLRPPRSQSAPIPEGNSIGTTSYSYQSSRIPVTQSFDSAGAQSTTRTYPTRGDPRPPQIRTTSTPSPFQYTETTQQTPRIYPNSFMETTQRTTRTYPNSYTETTQRTTRTYPNSDTKTTKRTYSNREDPRPPQIRTTSTPSPFQYTETTQQTHVNRENVAFVPTYESEGSYDTFNEQGKDKVMLCYIVSWAGTRPGLGKFTVADALNEYCSHIVYAFTHLNETSFGITLAESKHRGEIMKLQALRTFNQNLKILVSIGGHEEGSRHFSNMAATRETRGIFVNSLLNFVKEYNLDGIDISWQHPGLRDGSDMDRETSISLFRDIKRAFKPYGYLLTVYVLGHLNTEDAYDLRQVSATVDYINLAAMEYHGSWESIVGITTPLVSPDAANVKSNLDYVLKKGVPPSKLLLGLPLFGHAYAFAEESPSRRYIGAYYDSLVSSQWTNEPGIIAYNELCYEMSSPDRSDRWEEAWDAASQTPVAYKGRLFATYDNERSLKLKAKLARDRGLAGVLIWSLDMDDFRGVCAQSGGIKFPLLAAIHGTISSRGGGGRVTPAPAAVPSAPGVPRDPCYNVSQAGEYSIVSCEYGRK